jgi:hypothetical protein
VSNTNFTFNTNASGNSQVNQGQTVTGTQNNFSGAPLTGESVIDTLVAAVPKESQAELEQRVFGPLRHEIKTLAAMPVAQAESEKPTILSRMQSIITSMRNSPSLQAVQKVGLNFSEAALGAIAPPVGWFISGTISAIRALKQDPPREIQPPYGSEPSGHDASFGNDSGMGSPSGMSANW